MLETWTIVGTGLMGTALAERCLEAGRRVQVWNRSRDEAATLLMQGAEWTDRPFASDGPIFVSLYSSPVVEEVLQRFSPDWRAGSVIIDTTTGEPDAARRIAGMLATHGVAYLEAPISGSSEQTRQGKATVMVGGPLPQFEACRNLWPMLGQAVYYCGEHGSAARMKLVTNLVLGLNRAALAEGLAFAEAIGVDAAAALEVLQNSAAYSRQMDGKGPKMVSRDYAPVARLSQHLKDVRLMLAEAGSARLDLPLSQTHARLLEQAEAMGCGELDNSSIREVWKASPERTGQS